MAGYNPNIPIGVPYGRTGPASLPGEGGNTPFPGSNSGFNSTQPVYPGNGNLPTSPSGGGDCHGLPSWMCTLGSWAGKLGGTLEGFLPKDAKGNIDWGKLAGIGLGAAGAYTSYESGKAQEDYLNKLMQMKQDQINAGRADYASRAPIRDAVQSEILGKVKNQGNNIFTPYLGGK